MSIILNNFGARLLKEPSDKVEPEENSFDEIVRIHREYYNRENFNSDEKQVFEPTQEYRIYLENKMNPAGNSNDQVSI